MKTTEFFLEKSTQYLSEINSIMSNYIEFDQVVPSENDPYEIQKKKISDLKIKTKLLLSEFDKGEYLIDELKKSENEHLKNLIKFNNLLSYKSILELFIDHLHQFRL